MPDHPVFTPEPEPAVETVYTPVPSPAHKPLRVVILGLTITSCWGNGHATVFRSLVKALHEQEHDVVFLERDMPWYATHRDLPRPPFGRTFLYRDLADLYDRFTDVVRLADIAIVGSYVPDGIVVGQWVTTLCEGVTAFYDIDTPITMADLEHQTSSYLSRELIPAYDLYLSFAGGPVLDMLEHRYHAQRARSFYCAIDPSAYHMEQYEVRWDLGYLGTYSDDRQPSLERLMLETARRAPDLSMIVAGPQFPDSIAWPGNIERLDYLPATHHCRFYRTQRFTLNLTRAEMKRWGFSPSVRLFEAACCGIPVISDCWEGLDTFFTPEKELLMADTTEEVLQYLHDLPEAQRIAIGRQARARVMQEHTPWHRVRELERHYDDIHGLSSIISSAVLSTPATGIKESEREAGVPSELK